MAEDDLRPLGVLGEDSRLLEHGLEVADVVLAQVLNGPSFSWPLDGEALMRRHKPDFFGGPQKLRFTILSDRLKPYLRS